MIWRYWASAIFGIWVIFLPYLGFPQYIHNFFMVVSGLIITVFSFWSLSEAKSKNQQL